MKQYLLTLAVLALVIISLVIIINPNHCRLPDKDAVEISKQFLNKMGIPYKAEPQVDDYDKNVKKTWLLAVIFWFFPSDKDGKHVVIRDYGMTKQNITVNCEKEVVHYHDSGLSSQVFKKYNISTNNALPRKWPPILSESKAKEKAILYANKIGLPEDVVFSRMWLDLKNSGTWAAFWNRTHNGYPYEDDSLRIEIMAIDGEFYWYGKRFLGRPCPTEVKVSKEEAIAKGWKQISKYFDRGKWDKLRNEYEVKRTELKIVQPNTFLGFVVPWKSSRSRLAWVINYGLINPPNDKKRIEIGYHDMFVIKIDAANKSFLGGETGMYK